MERKVVEFTKSGKPVKHGAPAYVHHGCRCDECTKANSVRVNRRRHERTGSEPPEHGHSAYKNWGCRCEICTAANSASCKEYYWSRRYNGQ